MSEFMLLIAIDAKAGADISEADQAAMSAEYGTYTQGLIDAGVMRGGSALHAPDTAKTIAAGGIVTDGPFVETVEFLGGYYVIDVPSMDEALAWAGKIPAVQHSAGRVEVRPLVDMTASLPQ